jgi:hypothetical protein
MERHSAKSTSEDLNRFSSLGYPSGKRNASPPQSADEETQARSKPGSGILGGQGLWNRAARVASSQWPLSSRGIGDAAAAPRAA